MNERIVIPGDGENEQDASQRDLEARSEGRYAREIGRERGKGTNPRGLISGTKDQDGNGGKEVSIPLLFVCFVREVFTHR